MGDGVEELAAANGPRAAARGPLQMPFTAMDDILEVRYRPRAARPAGLSGQNGAQMLPCFWVMDV